MKVIFDILIGIVLASFGQIFFKLGTNSAGELGLSNILQFFNIYIIIGLICYALGAIVWIIALSKADLSYVYPFMALTYIVVFLASVILLKEPFHLSRMIGTGIIVLGVCVLFLFER